MKLTLYDYIRIQKSSIDVNCLMCSSLKMTTLFFAFVPNIPHYIAPKYFKEWYNTLRKFTWEVKKKSRVKLKKLKFSERMWRVGTARSE